ncbi:MAG: hypothetical protein ACRD5H_06750 [Nitrososphaerales archaeon]
MHKKQTTMLTSMAAVTMVGAMLVFSGVFGKAIAFNPTGAPDYTTAPQGTTNDLAGQVTKFIVEIDSPYGFERISSFKLFQTDNLMKQTGYQTLRLYGPIMNDKRTLMMWIENDLGKLQDGQYTSLPITTGGGKPAVVTKPAAGPTITTVPLSGKVKLMLLENRVDMYSQDHEYTRAFDFSGCHVAGYNLGTNVDDEKQFFRDGLQHFEEVVFACTTVKGVGGQSMNSRGIIVDTAINNDNRKIMNENGELIISSREYRQPIVMDNVQEKQEKPLGLEIVTALVADKESYEIGDAATFMVTFTDLEGNPINPDTIRAYYDGKLVQLEQLNVGLYTYVTPSLTKSHHQLIVSADKQDFATDTTYMSISIHRIN